MPRLIPLETGNPGAFAASRSAPPGEHRDLPLVADCGYISVKGAAFESHGHVDECEFHLFTRAGVQFVNGAERFDVRDGALVFSWPRTFHHCSSPPLDGEVAFYFVRFVPDTATANLLKRCEHRLPIAHARIVSLDWAATFEQIRRLTTEPSADLRRGAACLLLHLIYWLTSDIAPVSRPHPAVDRAIVLMRERVHGSLDLGECASAVGVGKPYLIRLFREHVGVSPMQYYLRLKMETARYLLHTTTEPVKAIAARLGFWDEFHFSRTFHRLSGASPRQYRLRNARGEPQLISGDGHGAGR